MSVTIDYGHNNSSYLVNYVVRIIGMIEMFTFNTSPLQYNTTRYINCTNKCNHTYLTLIPEGCHIKLSYSSPTLCKYQNSDARRALFIRPATHTQKRHAHTHKKGMCAHTHAHTPSVPPGVAAGPCALAPSGPGAPAVAAGSSASPHGRSSTVARLAPPRIPARSPPARRSSPEAEEKDGEPEWKRAMSTDLASFHLCYVKILQCVCQMHGTKTHFLKKCF